MEKDYENKIKRFLKAEGIFFFKYWGGGNFTVAGIPDIIACVNGRFVGIEVKDTKGKPSKLQLEVIEQIKNSGGVALVTYPEQFGELKELIYEIQRS